MLLLTTQFVSRLSLLGRYSECLWGFPVGSMGKESSWNAGGGDRHEFSPRVGKIPWRRAWLPTSLFLPGEFHEQRSLVGYSPWGREESDTSEATEHSQGVLLPCMPTAWLLTLALRQRNEDWGYKSGPIQSMWRKPPLLVSVSNELGHHFGMVLFGETAFSSLFFIVQSVLSNSLRPHRL